MTAAVFLDRDGTLIDDPGFLGDPTLVRLLPGVAGALALLREHGYRLVVITNQSGIGRGLLTEAQVAAVHHEIDRQLALEGVRVDGWYHCPHRPDEGCACRKPGTALHRQAAESLTLDLPRSWCVGDRSSDVAACTALGGRGVLLRTGRGGDHESEARAAGLPVAADLAAAARLIVERDLP